jgi:hypothetical protein
MIMKPSFEVDKFYKPKHFKYKETRLLQKKPAGFGVTLPSLRPLLSNSLYFLRTENNDY